MRLLGEEVFVPNVVELVVLANELVVNYEGQQERTKAVNPQQP